MKEIDDYYIKDIEIKGRFGSEKAYEKLVEWYKFILECDFRYVVFTPRGYDLARIMEKLTGIKMEDTQDKEYLTDSAYVLRMEKIVKCSIYSKYIPNRDMKVLLCDDAIMDASLINQIIYRFQGMGEYYYNKYTGKNLGHGNHSGKEDDRRLQIITEEIPTVIHTFLRIDTELLTDFVYECSVNYTIRQGHNRFYKVLSGIEQTKAKSNMLRPHYILSKSISYETLDSLSLPDYIESDLHNNNELTKIDYVGTSEKKVAVLTLRIIDNSDEIKPRIAPFVFMGSLNPNETNILINEIKNKIKLTSSPNSTEICNFIDGLVDVYDNKRLISEFITLIFGNVLLQEFTEKYDVEYDEEDYQDEILSIARNFNLHGIDNTIKILKEVLEMKLFSLNELKITIENTIQNGYKIATGNSRDSYNSYSNEEIKEEIESFFYEQKLEENKTYFRLYKEGGKFLSGRSALKGAKPALPIIELFTKNKTKDEADLAISYLHQMIDLGFIDINSSLPYWIKNKGFTQAIRTGETAMLYKPIKLNEWLYCMYEIEREAYLRGTSFEDLLDLYIGKSGDNIPEEIRDDIIKFYNEMHNIGHGFDDYIGFGIQYVEGNQVKTFGRSNQHHDNAMEFKKLLKKM